MSSHEREQVRPAARVLKFVSRAEQLRLRGQRNYSRYMQLTKGLVAADGPERAQWQQESAQESRRDTQWNQRYGPVAGGARILPFAGERARQRRGALRKVRKNS